MDNLKNNREVLSGLNGANYLLEVRQSVYKVILYDKNGEDEFSFYRKWSSFSKYISIVVLIIFSSSSKLTLLSNA
jgi:hypothetical protein